MHWTNTNNNKYGLHNVSLDFESEHADGGSFETIVTVTVNVHCQSHAKQTLNKLKCDVVRGKSHAAKCRLGWSRIWLVMAKAPVFSHNTPTWLLYISRELYDITNKEPKKCVFG